MTEADKQVLECLKARRSFLIDAGAGSGKTSSLIRALDYLRGPERETLIGDGQRVACITFTNVAKNEIIERTDHDPLFQVTTIHDFLWGSIRSFQKELKGALLTFNDRLPPKSRRKQDRVALETALVTKPVAYSDRGANFLEGRIFHDDLLGVATAMFETHPLLCRLIGAKYPFIFVDEYQDTHPEVIKILIDHLMKTRSPPLIGFFGDKVQSIYPDGVGELSEEHRAALTSIKKEENYRCSKAVIALLNKVRTDIQQVAAGQNKDGAAVYINLSGTNPDDIKMAALQKVKASFGWEVEGDLMILFLTHRLIARKAGYESLWTAYNDRGGFARDSFQAGEDPIAAFLASNIDAMIDAWRTGAVGQTLSLIGESNRPAPSKDGKARTRAALDKLVSIVDQGASIRGVLEHVRASGLAHLLDDLDLMVSGNAPAADEGSPEAQHQLFLTKLLALPFQEISRYRAVLERNLPFSTKHGVKGDEFENVLVVLDDAGANWNQYSFGSLLGGHDSSETRLKRSRNLFYVCCSRAKDKLVVADLGSPQPSKVESLFGVNSVAW